MKKVLFSILAALLLTTTVSASSNFSDVNDDTYYNTAIDWMQQNRVINGYEDGTFRPDNCVNRVELLKMLFKTLDVDINSYEAELFSDTYEGEWYTQYVIAGRARGTIDGYPDGTFKPGQCVNRAEALKMAVLEFNDGQVPAQWGMFGNPYDIAKVTDNPWWKEYFVSAMGSNTIGTEHFPRFEADWSGMGVDSDFANPTYNFEPAASMTRKEVAEMLYRMKALKDTGEEGSYNEDLVPAPLVLDNGLEIALSGLQGPLFAFNTETEAETEMFSDEYEVIAARTYANNPPSILVRKENQLFDYDTKTEALERIQMNDLKESERIHASVSITDDTQFKLAVFDTEETDGMYGYNVIASRYYFYDSVNNVLESIEDEAVMDLLTWNSGCSEYDSVNGRIFTWPCGEGIGSAPPISVYDIETGESEEIVSIDEFGNEYGAKVRYRDGQFIVISRRYDNDNDSYTPKILTIEPTEELTFTEYTFDPELVYGASIYGAMHLPDKNIFVIGGGYDITFLKYNTENEIYEMNKIDLGAAYVNFLFYDGEHIYIYFSGTIYQIDPEKAEITKQFGPAFLEDMNVEITTLLF